jgi:hypothetical protein
VARPFGQGDISQTRWARRRKRAGTEQGAVEQRGAQRGHQPRHARRDHSRLAVVVNGLREVADPLRQPVIVAERLPPLKPGRHHRVD